MTEQWQELKETITEMRDNDGTGSQQEVCKFLVNYMETLEKQMQEPKWISVKEDLPDLNGKYLVTIEYTDRRVIQIASYAKNLLEIDEYDFQGDTGDGWYQYDGEYGYYTINNVIAWMPLPEPYKEGMR